MLCVLFLKQQKKIYLFETGSKTSLSRVSALNASAHSINCINQPQKIILNNNVALEL